MIRPGTLPILVATVLCPVLTAEAHEEVVDFRKPVILAFSLVFGLVVLYLLTSFFKNAKVGDDLEDLKPQIDDVRQRLDEANRRLGELESRDRQAPPPPP